jgi:hypothetical protein
MNHTAFRHLVLLAFAFSLLDAQQPPEPLLRNWTAPLYWLPHPGEIEHQLGAALPRATSIFSAPGPMTFIALTPCRLMDTRSGQGFTGAFGPPSLSTQVPRQIPIPSSSCSVPSNAGAYSLNITAVSPGSQDVRFHGTRLGSGNRSMSGLMTLLPCEIYSIGDRVLTFVTASEKPSRVALWCFAYSMQSPPRETRARGRRKLLPTVKLVVARNPAN